MREPVGGTADALWDGEVARRLPQDVLELDGADHALVLAGDPLGSVDLLRDAWTRSSARSTAADSCKFRASARSSTVTPPT